MKKQDWKNTMAAVLAGLVTTMIISLIFFPLVRIILSKYLHLYIFTTAPPDSWKDDMIVEVTLYAWLFISFSGGGFVAAYIARNKELFGIITLIIVTFLTSNIISRGHLFEADRLSIIIQLLNPIGYLTGWRIALQYKQRKLKEAETTF
jgi:hypothetical protein